MKKLYRVEHNNLGSFHFKTEGVTEFSFKSDITNVFTHYTIM